MVLLLRLSHAFGPASAPPIGIGATIAATIMPTTQRERGAIPQPPCAMTRRRRGPIRANHNPHDVACKRLVLVSSEQRVQRQRVYAGLVNSRCSPRCTATPSITSVRPSEMPPIARRPVHTAVAVPVSSAIETASEREAARRAGAHARDLPADTHGGPCWCFGDGDDGGIDLWRVGLGATEEAHVSRPASGGRRLRTSPVTSTSTSSPARSTVSPRGTTTCRSRSTATTVDSRGRPSSAISLPIGRRAVGEGDLGEPGLAALERQQAHERADGHGLLDETR